MPSSEAVAQRVNNTHSEGQQFHWRLVDERGMAYISITFQVDAVCVDKSDVNKMPEQPKPPLPRLPADGIVTLHLVIPIYSTHVAVVPCEENWSTIDLLDNTIFLPLHRVDAEEVR